MEICSFMFLTQFLDYLLVSFLFTIVKHPFRMAIFGAHSFSGLVAEAYPLREWL